ncbi:MAG: DsrE family protein [Gemmatimonadota bacterium]|nr:DsrE family protein [Gemmatimonadota bacterium]
MIPNRLPAPPSRVPIVLSAALLGLAASCAQLSAQSRSFGPVIHSAGPVFEVPNPDVETPPEMQYRIAWEMVDPAPSPDQLNVHLVTAARFLNMHARAGVPVENLHLALVVHGQAGKAMLDDIGYREKEGVDNPNKELIRELHDAGVRIILCGQTAAARDLPRDRLLPEVEVALSAMTALLVLQDEGFHVNPF